MTKTNLRPGDKVYCILNHSIKGTVTSKNNHHGMLLYHVKVDDEKSFKKRTGMASINTAFQHWQLAKIYKKVKI